MNGPFRRTAWRSGGAAPPEHGRFDALVQGISWAVIVAVVFVLGAAVLLPRVAGALPYTILTGSMEPALPPGTLVVTREVETTQIGIGDVITYQLRSGQEQVVTHRVVGQGLNYLGEPIFTTKGDANRVVDPSPVRPVQVKGELWYSLPWLGHLNSAIGPGARRGAVDLACLALGGYMLWMFASALRDRARRRR